MDILINHVNRTMELRPIPPELLHFIFSFLDPLDRLRCGRVCSTWRAIVKDESLWRDVIKAIDKSWLREDTDGGFDTIIRWWRKRQSLKYAI